MADLMRRRVAVIKPGSNFVALAANAATRAIPIVFGVGEDPVKLGLVASLARPGGNLTGINFFGIELNAKPLALLHELVPEAVCIAVLVNPANIPGSESALRDLPETRPVQSGCKFRFSTPAPATRSRRPLPPLCATVPTPCTSLVTCSSRACVSNLRRLL